MSVGLQEHREREAHRKRTAYHDNVDLRTSRIRASRLYRIREYGITPERYAEMLEAQGGTCALCDLPEPVAGRSLAVDHDHKCCPDKKRSCGKCVRGLLCSRCNNVLGFIEALDADLSMFVSRIEGYTR